MKRRQFITLLGGAAAWPLAARAQQRERMRRIGVLMAFAESDREAQSWVAAFREELSKLGWTGGRNIEIDTRWATADVESMQRFAKELVALQSDLILTSSTPATAAMLQQTRAIPIIFVWVADPVGSGFVASLPRPGGNVTGFTPIEGSLGGKWVELLKEIAPRVARVTLLFNPAMATFVEKRLKPLIKSIRSSLNRRLGVLSTGFTRTTSICGKVAVVALGVPNLPDSCACATSEHAAATPTNRLMNSRRLISPRRRGHRG